MKRYIHNDKFLLDIQIILEYDTSEVAAAQLIRHPNNLKRRKRIQDLKLQILNDVAMSALSSVKSKKHLELVSHRQTSNTYSYYIDFNVLDDEGELLIPVRIRFRISDHKMKGEERDLDASSIVIRSFVLNGKTFDNSVSIISTIANICDELDKGNIFILDSYKL